MPQPAEGTKNLLLRNWKLFGNEGMKKKKDVTPPGFGRIAAQTAKQVIHQKIREAEKGALDG
jgi:hypothetical protein